MALRHSRLYKILERQSIAFLLAALCSSTLLIVVGILAEQNNTFVANIAIALGSSALGTCFGIVFGGITDASALQRVRELIEESTQSPLSATDRELEPLRKEWHFYHVTKYNDKSVWRYTHVNFNENSIPGKLTGNVLTPSPETGETAKYKVEGYLAAPRLILVETTDGSELLPIHIYPRVTETFRTHHTGLQILQTWDGSEITSPSIMSSIKIDLGSNYGNGNLPDSVHAKLAAIWDKASHPIGLTLKKNFAGFDDVEPSGNEPIVLR